MCAITTTIAITITIAIAIATTTGCTVSTNIYFINTHNTTRYSGQQGRHELFSDSCQIDYLCTINFG